MPREPKREISPQVTELEAFKEQCKVDAETIIREEFPRKVLDLQALVKSDNFNPRRLEEIGTKDIGIPIPPPLALDYVNGDAAKKPRMDTDDLPKGTQVKAFSCGLVATNDILAELVDIVKPECRQLIDYLNLIKMWITFLIPRIEDGNNFGVGVQEETLALVTQAEQDAATYLDQMSRFYLNRARIVSKIAKYPHIEDYRRTIRELDEKEFVSLRLILCELRNQYSSLHDVIQKNLDKIKKPRTAHNDHLFWTQLYFSAVCVLVLGS